MEKKKVQKHWDLTYATYWWRLYWIQGKEYSTSSSKVWGEMEAADKNMVLFRCLEMLINHGMLKKTHRIEIYRRQGAMIQLQGDPLVGTLYPTHFVFDMKQLQQFHCDYLDGVYLAINTGQPLPPGSKYKPVRKIKNSSLDQAFELAKKTTYASKQLFVHTYQYFKSCGVADGQLDAFERSIRAVQPYLFIVTDAVQNFVLPQKEKRLTPAADFYKDVHSKEQLQAAAGRVREKYDIANLPKGHTLKSLIEMELQQASNNLKK